MAVADYAEGKGLLPDELRTAFRCQQWSTLPRSGGLLDQPAGLVDKMTIAINTYNAWVNYINRDPKYDKDFFASDSWKIAKNVLEMRKNV